MNIIPIGTLHGGCTESAAIQSPELSLLSLGIKALYDLGYHGLAFASLVYSCGPLPLYQQANDHQLLSPGSSAGHAALMLSARPRDFSQEHGYSMLPPCRTTHAREDRGEEEQWRMLDQKNSAKFLLTMVQHKIETRLLHL